VTLRYEDLIVTAPYRSTAISKAEAQFIHDLVGKLKPGATLEVGMGIGGSAVAILSASDAPHIAMDPLQHEYENLGIRNVEKQGLAPRLRFLPEYSHAALPRLLAEGAKVDFAFIDGGHRFDDIFIDFYYVELLLNEGGHVLLHDAWMRSTQTVAAWVRRNKKNFARVPVAHKNLILFRKLGGDDRPWNHFRGFATWKSLISHSLNTAKRRVRAAFTGP
jgi:predicted O-methyltransferase YrrM